MTTPRTRRSKKEQSRDLLVQHRLAQHKKAQELKEVWAAAQAEVDQTDRILEMMSQEKLPGMEAATEEPPRIVYMPRPMLREETSGDIGHPNTMEAENARLSSPRIRTVIPDAHGKKAQGINDVWNAEEGSVTVHTAIMYERQGRCAWCKAGVPFTTAARTEHHVVVTDPWRGGLAFSSEPCTGVKE